MQVLSGRLMQVLTLAFVLLASAAAPAAADTFTVNTPADDGSGCDPTGPPGHLCTLRGALSDASDSPGSTVMVPQGTYVQAMGAGPLQIPRATTVIGAGARLTIIDATQPLGGAVTVVVLDAATRRLLASTRVTLAGDGSDTAAPLLSLAAR